MKRFTTAFLKYILYLAAIALVLLVCIYFVKLSRGPSIYDVLPQDIGSIEIRCYDFNFDSFADYSCTDPFVIEEFVRLIHQGTSANNHKCASPIRLILRMKTGKEVKFSALPGHDPEYYEIEHFDLRRVSRKAFLKVAQQLGMKQVPELCR